jgi:hypothetical protein
LVPAAVLIVAGLAIVGGLSNLSVPDVRPSASTVPASAATAPSAAASIPALVNGLPTQSPSMSPASMAPPPNTPTGFRHMAAPGIELDVPSDWEDVTAWGVGTYEIRNVAWLIDGVDGCPGAAPTAVPDATRVSPCLSSAGSDPGSITFNITEYVSPLPGAPTHWNSTTLGVYPAWTRPDDGGDLVGRFWLVAMPADALYIVVVKFPRADVRTRQPELDVVMDSLRFTGWKPTPPPVVDGRVRFDAGLGFSFDYPADWHVYYPGTHSFGGGTTRMFLLSRPVDACFLTPCDSYPAPPETMVLSFSIGGGLGTPDWTQANSTIGSQPAIRSDETDPVKPDVVMHDWVVKYGSSKLGIEAWIRGPNADAFERQLERLIDSVEVNPPPVYGP